MPTHLFARIAEQVAALLLFMFLIESAAAQSPDITEVAEPTLSRSEARPDFAQVSAHDLPSISDTHARSIQLRPDDSALFRIPLIGDLNDIGFRFATASGSHEFDGLSQQAVFADFNLPWAWSPWAGMLAKPRLVLEAGRLKNNSESRLFGSFGPALRLYDLRWKIPAFVDFGLGATVIDGVRYDNRDLGTSLNFTSHVALGLRFGRRDAHSVSLRYQHISNGGFSSVNPGVNMIGIDVAFWAIQ